MPFTSAERQARYRARHTTNVVDLHALRAPCWCEAEMLRVPDVLIRRGETLSCGAAHCGPDADAS